jgi:hypothetical protein
MVRSASVVVRIPRIAAGYSPPNTTIVRVVLSRERDLLTRRFV